MPDGDTSLEKQTVVSEPAASNWSARLLPVMVVMTVGLTLFFLAASMLQLNNLNEAIQDAPEMQLAPPAAGNQSEELVRFSAYLALEVNLIERRHHAANVALMARIWTRYMGFITGMTLAMVGAAFVLGRLSGGGTLSGGVGSAKMSLQTASPGLFMITLGAVLMVITITNHPRINVLDNAIYLPGLQGGSFAQGTTTGTQESTRIPQALGINPPAAPAWTADPND